MLARPQTIPESAALSPVRGVRRIKLADFRSYTTLDLEITSDLVVLTGENGAGKTNLLEALSFLCPGRGLRRAELNDCIRTGSGGGWAASVELHGADGPVQLGTGLEPASPETPQSRKCRIERAPVASPTAFSEYLRIVWLTPAMDGLFNGSAGERRRFLDRLVLSVDPSHGARVNAMERALRNRNRLLEEGMRDARWLDAAEHEVAELGVAVACARVETVSRLARLIEAERDAEALFPWAAVALEGQIERLAAEHPALVAEDRYRALLHANRARDAQAGRTLIGPQTADLAVRHGPKDIEAARASTGEQKALVVGLVLAHARLVAAMSGLAPLVLLDEIAAHFDVVRRTALYETLGALGSQVFMSGADAGAFADLNGRAQMLRVAQGRVSGIG